MFFVEDILGLRTAKPAAVPIFFRITLPPSSGKRKLIFELAQNKCLGNCGQDMTSQSEPEVTNMEQYVPPTCCSLPTALQVSCSSG